jgi:uncharacterized spore protein YtfJ
MEAGREEGIGLVGHGDGAGAAAGARVDDHALLLARKAAGELKQLQNTRTKLEKALAKEKEKRDSSAK